MTDEERQKLVRWLRNMQHMYGQSTEYGAIAEEIERLAAENSELRKTQLTFRTIERQPFTIKDEP